MPIFGQRWLIIIRQGIGLFQGIHNTQDKVGYYFILKGFHTTLTLKHQASIHMPLQKSNPLFVDSKRQTRLYRCVLGNKVNAQARHIRQLDGTIQCEVLLSKPKWIYMFWYEFFM